MIIIPRTSPIDAWPQERQKYGLLSRRTYIEDGKLVMEVESTTGDEIHFSDEIGLPAAPSGAGRPPSNAPPKSKLAQRLAEMHSKALKNPGQRQTVTLPGGLRIDLIVGIDGFTRLLLARQGVSYPSETKWKTTLAHFPYPLPADVQPEKIEYRGWRSLRAGWPSPEAK